MPLRVLVVDDEKPARDEITYMLTRLEPGGQIDEAANAVDALALLQRNRYDVLFLDIRMPGLSGLEAMRVINESPHRPHVVFVTAYDEHALEAFEVAAADYLLKPVSESRLRLTLERLSIQIARSTPEDSLADQMRQDKLPVEYDGRTIILNTREVRYVYSQGDYSFIRTFDQEYKSRYSLTELVRRLGPAGFLRVHRSYLVNLDHILEVHPFFGGTYVVIVNDKTRSQVPVARNSIRQLKATLGL